MRTHVLFLMVTVLSMLSGMAQDDTLSDIAEALFMNVNCDLNDMEKNQLAVSSGFALASNETQFYFKDDSYSAEFPFDVAVYPLDLNDDGTEEIAIVYGNMATSGAAGSSGVLFIQNADGIYEQQFGFPGLYSFISTGNMDFPDVCIAGPGFEFPVWRWNGTAYEMHRKISDAEMQELNPVNFQQAGEAYSNLIKD